jgi:hypothetical protein
MMMPGGLGVSFIVHDRRSLMAAGTDVIILKIFSQKKIAKKLAYLTHKAILCKIFDHNIGF